MRCFKLSFLNKIFEIFEIKFFKGIYINKRSHIKMSQYFPKPFRSFGGNINVKFHLSNYATKTDLKTVTQVDTSSFALKTNLANLETEADKLDFDKLAPVSNYLSKLSEVVKNEVIETTV